MEPLSDHDRRCVEVTRRLLLAEAADIRVSTDDPAWLRVAHDREHAAEECRRLLLERAKSHPAPTGASNTDRGPNP